MQIAWAIAMLGTVAVVGTPTAASRDTVLWRRQFLMSSVHGTGASRHGLRFGNATGLDVGGDNHLASSGVIDPVIELGYDHSGPSTARTRVEYVFARIDLFRKGRPVRGTGLCRVTGRSAINVARTRAVC